MLRVFIRVVGILLQEQLLVELLELLVLAFQLLLVHRVEGEVVMRHIALHGTVFVLFLLRDLGQLLREDIFLLLRIKWSQSWQLRPGLTWLLRQRLDPPSATRMTASRRLLALPILRNQGRVALRKEAIAGPRHRPWLQRSGCRLNIWRCLRPPLGVPSFILV